MTGTIVAGSPWTRAALAGMDPDYRADLEAAIPDGHRIVVAAGRKPGNWTLILRNYQGEVSRVDSRSIEIGCERLLDRQLVVEDTGAWQLVADRSPQ